MNGCGLVSVSFRAHTPEEIVAAAREAGLACIEWGSDVHVPEGDVRRAEEVRRLCDEADIAVSSYGSYYRLGNGQDIVPYLESAAALSAPTVRIWAGTKGSAEVSEAERRALVREAREVCRAAEKYRLKIDFEYHPNTLTDDAASAARLAGEVGAENLGLYWQPNYRLTHGENMSALELVLPSVDVLHLFYWLPDGERRPLAEGRERLADFLRTAKSRPVLKLLEFVPDDDIALLPREAAELRSIAAEAER